MAPEQDDPFAVVDTRADVYGLGRLGIRLLGEQAAPGSGTQLRLRNGVPVKVVDVLRAAVAHRPADRPADAAAFGAALELAADSPPAGTRRRGAGTAVGALLSLALLATVASDAVNAGSWAGPGHAADPTGRITVALPDGWHAKGAGWRGTSDADGDPEPALIMSPDPDRWTTDPAVPGAFVGLSRSQATSTPAAFVAGRAPADCVAAPVRRIRRSEIDWVIAAFTACPGRKPVIVETAGLGPGDAGLVYVEITPPADSGTEFVDELLAGVRVR
jgi:hypothetical protein